MLVFPHWKNVWRSALQIVAVYVIAAGCWLIGSAFLIQYYIVYDPVHLLLAHAVDGVIFVACSTGLLFYVTQRILKQLHRTEQHYRTLVETMHDAVFVHDDDGRYLDANRAACDLLGYSHAEICQRTITDLTAPAERAKLPHRMHALHHNGGHYIAERYLTARNGTVIPVELSISVVPHSTPRQYVAVVRDIRERRNAEAALERSEQRLSVVAASAPVILFALDRDGVFTLAEGQGLATVNYTPGQLRNKSIFALFSELDVTLAAARRALAGDMLASIEPHPDVPFETHWAPLHDDDGTVNGVVGVSIDISHRLRAEAERQKLALVVEHSSDMIAIASLRGELVFLNAAAQRKLNVPAVDASAPRQLKALVAPAARPHFCAQLVARVQRGTRWHGETQVINQHSGEVILVDLQCFMIRDPHNQQADRIAFVARDVTERQRMLTALQQSNATHQAMLNAMPDLVFRLDQQGVFLDAHAGKYITPLRTPDQTIGQSIDDIVPAQLATAVHAAIEQVLVTHDVHVLEYTLPDGPAAGEYEARFAACGADQVVAVVRDVTEQKRMDYTLRTARDVYLTLVEEAPMLVWRADTNGSFNFVNKRWSDYTGLQIDQIANQDAIVLVHPDDRANVVAASLKAWSVQQPFEVELRLRRDDGAYRWMETRNVPYFAAGTFAGYIGISIDIDERKQQEQIKDDFLALASHELKTPLAALVGYIHLLHRWNAHAQLGERYTQALAAMSEEGARLDRIINDLLDVTRIQTQRLHMRMQPVDLRQVLPRWLGSMELALPDHAFVLHAPDQPALVHADPQRLEQVVTNLCSNAAKYSPPNAPISVTLQTTATTVNICVQDHGVGIPAADLPYIFDRFYQVQRPLHVSRPGLGLGLFITHEIVRLHGGTISVHSREDEGSTFIVELPGLSDTDEGIKAGA